MEHLANVAVFIAVVEARSFAAAAERLQLARSAVSRRVNALESKLATRLLHRTTRRLSLTDAGQLFFERASRALREVEEAERDVQDLQGEPSGRLVVSMPMSFGLSHVVPALPAFRLRHPKIELHVRFDDKHVDLVAEGVDVALRIGKLDASSLVARRLAVIRHVVVASPAYLERHGEPASPRDLERHECLVYSLRSSPARWTFTSADGEAEHINVSGHLHTNNSLALREMLLAGIGITMTPAFVVAPDLVAGRLRQVLSAWRVLELGLHVVYPTRRHVAPAVRAFNAFFENYLGSPPHWEVPGAAP